MKLAKMIHRMKLSGIPNKICNRYARLVKSKDLTQKIIETYFGELSACVDSSKTVEVLMHFFGQREFPSIEINAIIELYPHEQEFAFKVLHLIASTQAEPLQTFSIFSAEVKKSDSVPRLEKSMLDEITKLKQLRKLLINKYAMTLVDVVDMCSNMPQLRSIKLRVDNGEKHLPIIDSEGFASKFSKTFIRIEKFRFEPVGDKKSNERFLEKLTNFCIKNLPNLVLVGSEEFFTNMSQSIMEMKKKSKLKHVKMYAWKLKEAAENFDKFPSVVTLEILFDAERDDPDDRPLSEDVMNSLGKLTKLTVLKFENVTSTIKMQNFLSVSRRKLEQLVFEYTNNNNPMIIDLNLIRVMCPKLKILELHMTDVDDLSDSMASFTSLNELKIDFFAGSRTGHLPDLLRPPNLQNVRLSGIKVSIKELKKTIKLVKTKKVLRQIKSLTLELNNDVGLRKKVTLERDLDTLEKMVLNKGKNILVKCEFAKM